MARNFARKYIIAAAACLAGMLLFEQPSANAAPFHLQFQSTLTAANVTGTAVGNVIIFDVIVDNGGAGFTSESWGQADVVSAQASVGTYSATFNAPFGLSEPLFTTNAAGVVDLADWLDFDGGNTDNAGGPGSPTALGFVLQPSTAGTGGILVFADDLGEASNWTVQAVVSIIPVPAALPLLLGGIGLLGLIGWRRRRLSTPQI